MRPQHRRLEAVVSGRVQGVGFRWFVQRQASLLGLTGGVRNLSDGSVEVVAEGPPAGLADLLIDLKAGPSGAHITGVTPADLPSTGEFSSFTIWSSR